MKTLFTLVFSFGLALGAHGQLIVSFSGGNDLNVGPGTAGYEFTVGASALSVAALGVWASANDGVLTTAHEVGLWDASSHTLLASAVVTPGASVDVDGFWYANLASPIALAAGKSFVLAARYADVDFDQARGNVTSVTMHGATMGDALLSSGTGFAFPDLNVSGANLGFIGPNAAFVAVPEPGGLAILSAAACLAVAAWRRR